MSNVTEWNEISRDLDKLHRMRTSLDESKHQIELLEGTTFGGLESKIKSFASVEMAVGDTLAGENLEVHHGKGKWTVNVEGIEFLISLFPWWKQVLKKLGDDVISIRKTRQPDPESDDQLQETQVF